MPGVGLVMLVGEKVRALPIESESLVVMVPGVLRFPVISRIDWRVLSRGDCCSATPLTCPAGLWTS